MLKSRDPSLLPARDICNNNFTFEPKALGRSPRAPRRSCHWANKGGGAMGRRSRAPGRAIFSFLYLKKIKISKIYVGFEKFQKYTPVALWGRQTLNVIFFFKFATRSLVEGAREQGGCRPPPPGRQGGPVVPPSGDWGSPPTGATEGLSPSLGRPALPLLYKHSISISSSFEPKNSTKNPEKREVSTFSLCIFP